MLGIFEPSGLRNSYHMALRMIQNDSIENNMKMYLDQITKNTDEAYYDMLSIVNSYGTLRSANGKREMDSYLDAVDNFEKFCLKQSILLHSFGNLGYAENTKLVGVTYYDKEEKKELISGMMLEHWNRRQNALRKVVKCAKVLCRQPMRLWE